MRTEFKNDSWIYLVTYDTETRLMQVYVKGNKNLYELVDVPEEVYNSFRDSVSKGTFFNQNLKGKYMDKMFKP